MIIIYDLFQEVEYSECSVLKILKMLKKDFNIQMKKKRQL